MTSRCTRWGARTSQSATRCSRKRSMTMKCSVTPVSSPRRTEPVGLCRANELYYVTTSGGPFDGRFGYDYWKTIAQDCFGIPTVKLLEAENLDIVGADAEKIVDDAIKAYGPA